MVVNIDEIFTIRGEGEGDQAVGTIVRVVVAFQGFSRCVANAKHGVQRRGDRSSMYPDVEFLAFLRLELKVVLVAVFRNYAVESEGESQFGCSGLFPVVVRFDFTDASSLILFGDGAEAPLLSEKYPKSGSALFGS